MKTRRMALSGDVIRSIVATARTRTEYFSVIFDASVGPRDTARRADVPGCVLGERAFRGMSHEAITIWDAVLPGDARADPVAWFEGNELRDPPPPMRANAAHLDALPDSEFWPVIDSLEGRLWARILDAAVGRLAALPEDFLLRWAQTAGEKAVAVADALERAGISAFGEIHAIGAVLGAGKQVYEAVLARPGELDLGWRTDNSPQVIRLAEHALARKTGRGVDIVTAFSAREREIAAREAEDVAAYQRENGIELGPDDPHFRAARAIVAASGVLRERVVLVPGWPSPGEVAVAALTADGGALVTGPEFANQQGIGLWGGEAFIIRRRTSLDLDEYVRRYSTVPER